MGHEEDKPLKIALDHLKDAIGRYRKRAAGDQLPFLTVSKAFEIAVEYGWRHLKRSVEEEGLEAPSPKTAVREAARINLIKDPQTWLDAIEARNASVHDYFGIGEKDFVRFAEKLVELCESLLRKLK